MCYDMSVKFWQCHPFAIIAKKIVVAIALYVANGQAVGHRRDIIIYAVCLLFGY